MKTIIPVQARFFPGFAITARRVKRLAADCLTYVPALDDPRFGFWGGANSLYKDDHSASDGTNVSGSRSMASLIADSSLAVFLRTVNFCDISINLPIIGFPQTYDAQPGLTNREDHNMKSFADECVCQNASLGIVSAQVWQIARTFPIHFISRLKVDAMNLRVREPLCLVPLANQHPNSLRSYFSHEVYT